MDKLQIDLKQADDRGATDDLRSRSRMNRRYVGEALPAVGFVRLASIIGPRGPIPVSKSTWWAGVKSGRYPKPVKLGPRITAWRVEDIRALIQGASPS